MPPGATLTEAHRIAQARLGLAVTQRLTALWRLVDPNAVDATAERWLRLAVPTVQRGRAASAQLAAGYYRRLREVEVGAEPFTAFMDSIADAEQVATSLRVTGPYSLKTAVGAGTALRDATREAALRSALAGTRHALNGGRNTVLRNVATDKVSVGYYRVTSSRPCAFCAMLASRGAVYKKRSFSSSDALFVGDGDAKVHDHCSCTFAPMFSRDAELPATSLEFQRMWADAKLAAAADPNLDTVTAFRRAVETR